MPLGLRPEIAHTSYTIPSLLEGFDVGGGVSVAGSFGAVGQDDAGELREVVGGPEVEGATGLSPAGAAFGADSSESVSDGSVGLANLVTLPNVADIVGG